MADGPRIPPVGEPDEEQLAALAKAPRLTDGSVRNIFGTLAHHPMLLKRFNAFSGTFFLSGKLSDYDRELLILRVAGRCGSRYEFGQHLPIGRAAGLDDERIGAILCQPGAPPLPAADQLLAAVADQLLESGIVDGPHWEQLSERFETDALLEVIFIVGFYRMTADFLATAGVELEEEPDLEIDWQG